MSQRYLGGVITANPTTPTMTTESGVWTLEQQFQYSNVWSPKIVGNSVRLRSSANAYFNRTPGSASNRTTWTWSGWVKRGTLGNAVNMLLTAGPWTNNNQLTWFGFKTNNTFGVEAGIFGISTEFAGETTAVFRDPSAWYHIVVAFDSTQATAANRVKVYINSALYSLSAYPSQNYQAAINNNVGHRLGNQPLGGGGENFDGYLAEINFIDGQALTPSSFGAFDSTGVWQPLPYTGTYGTNGFYLTFADNSGVTATTIGKDYSGNGNNWTPNNISVTAGSTYDWMLDSPTNWIGAAGGNGVGNYCTVNPLAGSVFSTYVSVTEGNLRATNLNAGAGVPAGGTIMVSSGKWYAEIQVLVMGPNTNTMGITSNVNDTNALGNGGGTVSYGYVSNGNKRSSAGSSAYGATWGVNDIIGIALDMDAGTVAFYKNGVAQGTAFTGLSGNYTFAGDQFGNGSIAFNFGQRPFAYTPPTGFKALNTQNLPTPTITNGAAYMAASLYTGNGGSLTVTNTVNGTSFQPDFVWLKARSQAYDHKLVDSVRGASGGIYYELDSNLTNAETLPGAGVTALNSNGFSIGNSTNNGYNGNGTTFVAWQWKANGTPAVTNTAGNITSTVSANTTAGFSIVTYTGTGGGGSVGHGLGAVPKLIIVKNRNPSGTFDWAVYHGSNPATVVLGLNATYANFTQGTWNNTAPTSTTFFVGAINSVNESGKNIVAYCFAPVAGFSAFGSYTGNGSTDGPFVYTGFRPRWIMVKRTDSTGNWWMFDSARDTYNNMNKRLLANSSVAEDLNTMFQFFANGFKLNGTNDAEVNANGGTYIYACFAENPFNIARAR